MYGDIMSIRKRGSRKFGDVRFLSKSDVEALVTPRKTLEMVDQVLKWITQGRVREMFLSSELTRWSQPSGPRIYPHVAFIEPLNAAGDKWAETFPNNMSKELPSVAGIVVLSDSKTGVPYCIMDDTSITALRTPGLASLGAKYLAREDSSTVAIIGCGQQGKNHSASALLPFFVVQGMTYAVSQIKWQLDIDLTSYWISPMVSWNCVL